MPLASVYFKRHKKTDEHVNPARYLAQGHGKKTAGFAAVVPEFDHLVVRRIEYRKRMANGVGEAFSNFLSAVQSRRSLAGPDAIKMIENRDG